jgi:hypothetical protein
MQYIIIIIGGSPSIFDRVKSMRFPGNVARYDVDATRYCVDFGTDHVFIDDDDEGLVAKDFEAGELDALPFAEPHSVTLVYTAEERMRQIVSQEDFPKDVYIDNDFWLTLPVEEFIARGMPLDSRPEVKGSSLFA